MTDGECEKETLVEFGTQSLKHLVKLQNTKNIPIVGLQARWQTIVR